MVCATPMDQSLIQKQSYPNIVYFKLLSLALLFLQLYPGLVQQPTFVSQLSVVNTHFRKFVLSCLAHDTSSGAARISLRGRGKVS